MAKKNVTEEQKTEGPVYSWLKDEWKGGKPLQRRTLGTYKAGVRDAFPGLSLEDLAKKANEIAQESSITLLKPLSADDMIPTGKADDDDDKPKKAPVSSEPTNAELIALKTEIDGRGKDVVKALELLEILAVKVGSMEKVMKGVATLKALGSL
jgi:hypothetical protein